MKEKTIELNGGHLKVKKSITYYSNSCSIGLEINVDIKRLEKVLKKPKAFKIRKEYNDGIKRKI